MKKYFEKYLNFQCKIWALFLVSLVCFGGCAAKEENSLAYERYVQAKLEASAVAIQRDLRELATLSPKPYEGTALEEEGGLSRRIDFSFDGTLEEALRHVAAESGYRFIVAGRKERDALVHIRQEGSSCRKVLEEIGLQTGRKEEIALDEDAKTITLRYREGVRS